MTALAYVILSQGKGKALGKAPISSPPIAKNTIQKDLGHGGQKSRSQSPQTISETSHGSSRTSSQSPWAPSSSKESPSKPLRVRRTTELIVALEAEAGEVLKRRLRSKPFRGPPRRGRSAPVVQNRPEAADRLHTRKCASDDEDSPALKRLVRCNAEPGGRQKNGQTFGSTNDMLQLPPDMPFTVFREKLKRWLLAEGPGLELARGKKMSYNEWMRHYYEHRKGEVPLSSQQQSPPSRRKDRVPMVAVRLKRASQAPPPASEQSVQIQEDKPSQS